MAITLTHTTVAVGTDAGNGEIRKAQWNENHTLTMATNKLLGRATAGDGAVEEIDCTAAGRALLDDADAAAQRTTLGVGTGDSPTFTGLTLSGVATLSAGTALLPSLTTSGNLNTGMWFPAADTIALSTGGSERVRINSTGNIGVGVTNPSSFVEIYAPTNASLLVSGDAGATISVNRHSDNVTGPNINQRKYRGTRASPTAVQSGDGLGLNQFQAYDGSQLRSVGSLSCFVETYTGSDDLSGYLVLSTRPNGVGGSLTQRMRITSAGNVGIGTTAPDALLSVNGIASFGDGAAATPSIANFGDLNTGMWFPAADTIAFSTGGSERLRVDANGNVVINTAAIATAATDGFLYVPSCAGTPTGTPTTFTGRVPIVVDTTNNKLYFYSGGQWRDAGP